MLLNLNRFDDRVKVWDNIFANNDRLSLDQFWTEISNH